MNLYSYDGPVFEFDTCINRRWKGTTYAVSESKARNNLTYQYKMQNNLKPRTKISIPGKITLVSEQKELYYG